LAFNCNLCFPENGSDIIAFLFMLFAGYFVGYAYFNSQELIMPLINLAGSFIGYLLHVKGNNRNDPNL
jgi:hypothetical protein